MNNKGILALLEQVLMLLVFAVAAAVCIRAFVWADAKAVRNGKVDRAYVAAQSAAEVVKHTAGEFPRAAQLHGGRGEEASWVLHYDENWKMTGENGCYTVTVEKIPSQEPLLGCAQVTVTEDGEILCCLKICWQEVEP